MPHRFFPLPFSHRSVCYRRRRRVRPRRRLESPSSHPSATAGKLCRCESTPTQAYIARSSSDVHIRRLVISVVMFFSGFVSEVCAQVLTKVHGVFIEVAPDSNTLIRGSQGGRPQDRDMTQKQSPFVVRAKRSEVGQQRPALRHDIRCRQCLAQFSIR